MTSAHKEARAPGRAHGLAVRRYLEALELNRPRRGRRASADSLQRQLEEVESALEEADALKRLHLLQQRKNIMARLDAGEEHAGDLSELEEGFVEVAADYGARKGIDYATWREAGVPVDVLRRAGVHRGTRQ
jgi:hypothetical protein